jgi:Domain of unknown function (DUF1707)
VTHHPIDGHRETAMSETENNGERSPRGVRAGDADRDFVVEQLRAHHEAGRLDAEEFSERMAAALSARWLHELPPLLADLPPAPGGEGVGEGVKEPAEDPGQGPAGAGHHAGHGHPFGGSGQPPWRHGGVPVVPLLLALAVLASLGALAHGHFPGPLLWAALLVAWLRPWRRGAPRRDGRPAGGRTWRAAQAWSRPR